MKTHTIAIQIKISNENLGSEFDLDLRHRIEDVMEKALAKLNNGVVDGGQIGGGAMEIFIEEVVDVDFALDVIISEMKRLNLNRHYKIAWLDGNKWKVAFATDNAKLFEFDLWKF